MNNPIKIITGSILLLFSFVPVSAQQINNTPLKKSSEEVFREIEAVKDIRIFCDVKELDSLTVSRTFSADEDPVRYLENLLTGTAFKVSAYKNNLFITKEQPIAIRLERQTVQPGDTADFPSRYETVFSSLSLIRGESDQAATSEYKVYEIGNVAAASKNQVTLTGNIYDFKTGEPLPGVSLYIENTNIGAISDTYGYYSLHLPPGRQLLKITGGGMKETQRQLQVHTDGKLDIELEEKVYALKEVTVLSERVDNIRSLTMGTERLRMKDIKNIPTAFGEADVLRIVMSLPGVKSSGEISSGFNVRGGATDQNLILFNEGTIYNPTHLFGLFSAFNPDVVQDIELYKSSIPTKYGGRISSVLDINSREGNKKEFQGSASLGLLTSRLTLEGPVFSKKTSFILGGRTTYSDWLLKELPKKSGYSDGNAGFYDMNAMINHRFDENNSLYVSGYYSHDRFRFNQEEKYAYENANASIKWRHLFTPKTIGVFTAGYDHFRYDVSESDDPANAYQLNYDINQFFVKADFNASISNQHTLNWGYNGILYNMNPGTYDPKGESSLVTPDQIEKEKAIESAFYLGDQWDISPELSVSAGIRYSLFQVLGKRHYNVYNDQYLPSLETVVEQVSSKSGVLKTYHGPEFRLSARYTLTDDLSVKAGINSMRQYIHKISNTTVMSPTDTWKLADMNIKPQQGIQIAGGIYKNFLDNTLETSIEGYYKTMKDYLDYRNGSQLVMNHHIETEVINTKGRAYGVELMVKKNRGKLNGWISYTYSRTQLRQDDPKISLPVNNGEWYAADFDKPHEVKMVGNYKFTHRFSFSLNFDYSTGRPATLPVSKFNYAGGEFVYYSDRNQYRIPDYFRIDASFNIEPSHHLTLLTHSFFTVGVYNVTGRKNVHSVYYISEEGQLKGYKMAIFGAPIPFVSYNIKF